MLDVIYIFRHSPAEDLELRYSLRSLHLHAPFVRKVWIFGDRPAFLTDDTSLVEHVPHEYVARIGNFRIPVTNTFLMIFLSSLLPELSSPYLWFCDDYILLDHLSEEAASKTRYLEDMDLVKARGSGLWKDALWRTYDLLKRFGYPGLNFETHMPTLLTKKQVLEAYLDFRDFVTEDRFYGLLARTAILNHACKQTPGELTLIATERRKIAFHDRTPTYEEIAEKCRGMTYLNFDDMAFGDGMRRYLAERFPHPSIYERAADAAPQSPAGRGGSSLRGRGADPADVRVQPGGESRAAAEPLAETFRRIYQSNACRSGHASPAEAETALGTWLAATCREREIRTIVDLGCGDWSWMRLVLPHADLHSYLGYDIVPELIEHNRRQYGSAKVAFEVADVTTVPLPKADLVVCRDCLDHLSYKHIMQILAAVKKSGAAYFAATTFPGVANRDVPDGRWRPLNLGAPPFGFPESEDSVTEGVWGKAAVVVCRESPGTADKTGRLARAERKRVDEPLLQ